MIDWPVILKHANDPELDYFENLGALEKGVSQYKSGIDEDDYLVDAGGRVYAVVLPETGEVQLKDLGKQKTLEQVLGLVKAHAAQEKSCCVAKVWAPTIREALAIVHSVTAGNR